MNNKTIMSHLRRLSISSQHFFSTIISHRRCFQLRCIVLSPFRGDIMVIGICLIINHIVVLLIHDTHFVL